jgi:hypothetical protein
MEAAISCKFHCKSLEGHWKEYWPAKDPAELTADIKERLAAATAALRSHPARAARGRADVWALIDPLAMEDFPADPGQAEATAERWLDRYARAAEMALGRAREWTRIRAGAEANEVHDSGWGAALRRMADVLG